MPRPITLTLGLIEQMKAEFAAQLMKAKLSDGKITYTKSFTYKDKTSKVHVLFTPLAYTKMLALLKHCNDEVAWHGFVERRGIDEFLITDLIVYPQEVTGATVTTDQERYQRWIMEIDDGKFNSMRMQGHSHVHMATTPSGTDLNHQEQILSQLKGNDFYIFMIWNKDLAHNVKVYDLSTNTLYEDSDVVIDVVDEDFGLDEFLTQIDKLVVKKKLETPIPKDQKVKPYPKSTAKDRRAKENASYGKGFPYSSYEPDYDEFIFGSYNR